jgi:hypothetical protein
MTMQSAIETGVLDLLHAEGRGMVLLTARLYYG